MSTLNTPKLSILLSFLFLICLVSISVATANAATYTVTNTADSGAGSLRQAVINANGSADNDTIEFDLSACPCVITLTTGELSIANGGLTISGPGADQLSVSGNNASRVFLINFGADVVINGITVTMGNGNYSGSGGGIYNRGSLTVANSTISDNSSQGYGGGITNQRTLILTNSTVSNNRANYGGGLDSSSRARVTNSTFNNNSANFGAGGISNSFNEGDGNRLTLVNSIIANSAGPDCVSDGGGVNASYSLIEDGLGCVNGTNINNLTGDPMLGTLQYNGGPTKTHALLPGSPAIDAGGPTDLTTDQRGTGFPRVVGGAADIGAFESSNDLVVNTTAQDDDGACQPLSDGDCTLREAILAANAAAGTETIIFDIPTTDPGYDLDSDRYTITLTSVLPDLDSDMAIDGLGAKRLTVTRGGGGTFRIFHIKTGASVSILGLTISGGLATQGGGIRNDGSLSLAGSHIKDNQTTSNYQEPWCDLAYRSAGGGGGVLNSGYLLIDSSLFSGNRTGNGAPGFSHPESECWVSGGNGGEGGGVSSPSGTLIIRNSTFSGNRTGNGGQDLGGGNSGGDGGNGGAIYNGGSLSVSNTTINANQLGNNARGAIFNESNAPGSFSLSSSIVANTDGLKDIVGIVSGDSNLVEDGFVAGGENITGIDPKLGPLADNGGPTNTHALICGSPAIDAGKSFAASGTDQRGTGFSRTFDDLAAANAADGDGTDIGAFELQEALVCNTAPIANTDANSTNEDTILSGSSVLANDSDGENDTLTVVLVSGPANAQAFTLNPGGTFTYTPNANFNGNDSFTYKANDGSLDSNVATVTITVNPVNDAPGISLTPQSQSVQYSDAIAGVAVTATDVDAASLSLLTQFNVGGGAFEPGLPTGLAIGSTMCTPGGSGVSCTASLTGTANVPAGTYTIRFTGSDGTLTASADHTLTVLRENATVTPSATNPASVKVNAAGGTAGPITLCADITDAADGSLGNIAYAVPVTFRLTPVAAGSSLELQDATLSGGTACVTFNSVPVNVYDVGITVGGDYYTGAGSSVLAVFDPTLGFTTGGGKVLNPSTGSLLHFGFSFKYDRKGFKGQMLVMEHLADGSVVKLKSNSLTSLSIVGNRALVLGKANMLYADGTSLGNLGFRLDATDNGEPGSSDLFGLKTTTAGGAPIDAFWIDPPSTILSGNIQVPQGAKK